MPQPTKDWDRHVSHAEEVARGHGFRALRDTLVAEAEAGPEEHVLDVGAGTGLLTLPLAEHAKRVWALDISPAMCDYLRTKVASADLDNVYVVVGSAVSLPLVDESIDVVVSNYCFHHLRDADKERALAEVRRVLRPGGRLVFGDMMFSASMGDPRNRRVIGDKIRVLLRRGPAGVVRLAKNGGRLLVGRWESPARAQWWATALPRAGFVDVSLTTLDHEGGTAVARKPGGVPLQLAHASGAAKRD